MREIVWTVVERDLSTLKPAIEQLLTELERSAEA